MKTLLMVIVALFVIVLGLSFYLTPDDLMACADRPDQTKICERADAIVAISGGDTMARADEAIRLYQNSWAGTLIFSGAAQDKTGPSNAEAMRRHALERGVPDSAIILEEESATTKQNAKKTRNIFEERGASSVILVTSAYHQRRAGLEFTQSAGKNVVVRNHPVATDKQWAGRWWWLTPTGWYLAVSEFFKVIVFYMGGTR